MTARPRTARFGDTRVGVAAVALVAAGLLSACTTVGDPATTAGASSTEGSSTGSPSDSAPAAPADGLPSGVTTEIAQQLCTDLADQTQAMRTYTVTIGKVTLNGVVGTWAFKNNLNLVDLAQHRGKIDSILETQCPDVRTEVMSALELPDIASGLAGT